MRKEIRMKYALRILVVGTLAGPALLGCATQAPAAKTKPGQFNFLMGAASDKNKANVEDKAQGEGPVTAATVHERAAGALQQGKLELALYYYVKALEFNPKDAAAFNAIAQIHEQRGNLELSTAAYRVVVQLEPDNLNAAQRLGLALVKLSRPKDAELHLQRVLMGDPSNVRALLGLAASADMRGDYEKSKPHYDRALAIEPNSPRVLNNYAYSRYLAGSWEQADELYQQLVRIAPNHPQAWLNYGLLQARRNRMQEALQSFQRVLPDAQAYNELGYVYLLDRRYEQAKQLFQQAISLSPTYFERANKNLQQVNALMSQQEQQSRSRLPTLPATPLPLK